MDSQAPLKVSVLGGGVSGLTTGIVLLLHGHNVRLYTKEKPWEMSALLYRPPELASVHAAASVLPHSIGGGDGAGVGQLVQQSQRFFHRLAFCANFGVRQQRHYELFEERTPPPAFARLLEGFEFLPDGEAWVNQRYRTVPKREATSELWGWFFNVFFCEANTYLDCLFRLYQSLGGRVEEQLLRRESLSQDVKGDVVVNCTGSGTTKLFDDDDDTLVFVRGHMVKVNSYDVPVDHEGMYFSYNYKPHPRSHVYPMKVDGEGKCIESSDVYFYPRSDCWLLGGSRQEQLNGQEWSDVAVRDSKYQFKKGRWSEPVPRPIWELNRELILASTGQDIERFRSTSYIGYRSVRKKGVRVEKSATLLGSRTVIHNYGHGGAGYTLSWGCALKVQELIESLGWAPTFFQPAQPSESLQRIALHLSDLSARMFRERHVEVHTTESDEEVIRDTAR